MDVLSFRVPRLSHPRVESFHCQWLDMTGECSDVLTVCEKDPPWPELCLDKSVIPTDIWRDRFATLRGVHSDNRYFTVADKLLYSWKLSPE